MDLYVTVRPQITSSDLQHRIQANAICVYDRISLGNRTRSLDSKIAYKAMKMELMNSIAQLSYTTPTCGLLHGTIGSGPDRGWSTYCRSRTTFNALIAKLFAFPSSPNVKTKSSVEYFP